MRVTNTVPGRLTLPPAATAAAVDTRRYRRPPRCVEWPTRGPQTAFRAGAEVVVGVTREAIHGGSAEERAAAGHPPTWRSARIVTALSPAATKSTAAPNGGHARGV